MKRRELDTVFGYPGGIIISIYDEFVDLSIKHILVSHEQCVAYMVDGYARVSGRTSVCIVTSGPMATNLVTGVATAFANSVPMIAFTGQINTGSLGLSVFQKVDAYSLIMPITKHNFRVLDVSRLPHAITEVWEICQSGCLGPIHIDLLIDQMNSSVDKGILNKKYGVKPQYENLSDFEQAVQWIKVVKCPIILVGGDSVCAYREIMDLSQLLQAPVNTILMSTGVVPFTYDLCMGPGDAWQNLCPPRHERGGPIHIYW